MYSEYFGIYHSLHASQATDVYDSIRETNAPIGIAVAFVLVLLDDGNVRGHDGFCA